MPLNIVGQRTAEENNAEKSKGLPFKDMIFIRFLPGICVCMVWLYIVNYNHLPCECRILYTIQRAQITINCIAPLNYYSAVHSLARGR